MKTSDVLINHLISFMEKQKDIWDVKDIDSRIIYANKTVLNTSCLPMNFNIEGKQISECPVSWSEHVHATHACEQIVIHSDKPIFIINTHFVSKEQEVQSFFIEKIPYHDKNKIVGTICHGRKISPRLLSEHFFKNPSKPSFLTNHSPNNLFTTEELNVLFFAMELMSNQEIALRLGISYRAVEQIIQQIYKKTDIYSRKQLRDYGIAEGFDNYFPPFFLKGLL